MLNSPLKTFSRDEILEMDRFFRTTFMNSVSGFKSLNLCGTISKEGITNLPVFNSIVHIGANPPYLGMIFRPHTVPRHTLENIKETQYYTLNHVNQEIYTAAHQTSARFPEEQSEFEAAGLTPMQQKFPAPYVAEANIRMGLKFQESHQILNETILVIGSVEEVQVPENVIGKDGYIDLAQAGSLTVAGLDAYHTATLIDRLSYAKPDRDPETLL